MVMYDALYTWCRSLQDGNAQLADRGMKEARRG